ncbi:DNA polymerase III subunit beta [Pseudomonas protegens]|uniref:DNA polymerase III subunit beta n=1 Tax=Pseudomonas protegens TaxID=380021 RepID=A0A2T6GR99_9PSED|nr:MULTISPECIES: nucleotidyltransferase domain-containing protein [Pseudomonas]PUA46674.1 DNA polymerase III subunit beta [Pseudomonas protegens]ULT68449.1 nucleotidyltransferase domain-containing protein [Pseudomonas sp. BC42]
MQSCSAFGVDADGLITLPAEPPLQPEYLGVLDDLCASLHTPANPPLHSLYLYGSVARGTARPGVSDLDLCLILQHPATPQQLRHLEQLRQALQARHPRVSKIDFDIGHLAQVLAAENLDSWGYWLKHHCRCLSGEDLRRRFAPFRPSREIALAVNGDFQRVLDDYAERIEGERQPAQILRLQREASRKLIRATHLLRAEQEPSWPHSLDEHVRLFVQRYPDMAAPIAEFRQTAEAGAAASAGFSRRLRQMVQWMAAEHIRPRARN